MTTKKQIKEMADRLISTLDSLMPSEEADSIVRDVAEELYRDVLGIPGKIVVDESQARGFIHGSFGKGKRMMPIAKYKFEAELRSGADQQ
jgi:hypothetical protein